MDKRPQLLLYLYGEADDREAVRRDLEADPVLRREHDRLSQAKFVLDHRRPARPDADVVDRLVAASAPGAAPPPRPARPLGGRADRPARARRSLRRGLVGALTTLSVVAALVVWYPEAPAERGAPAVAAAAPTTDSVDQTLSTTLQAFQRGAPQPVAGLGTATPAGLGWDDAEALRRLRQRAALLEARSAPDRWDAPQFNPEALVPSPAPGTTTLERFANPPTTRLSDPSRH